jgi:hypothetical protein
MTLSGTCYVTYGYPSTKTTHCTCQSMLSGSLYRRKRDLNACPPGHLRCPVLHGRGGMECVDVASDIESCGGCVDWDGTALGTGVRSGVDCTSLEGVDGVSCMEGVCMVGMSCTLLLSEVIGCSSPPPSGLRPWLSSRPPSLDVRPYGAYAHTGPLLTDPPDHSTYFVSSLKIAYRPCHIGCFGDDVLYALVEDAAARSVSSARHVHPRPAKHSSHAVA